MLSTGQRAFFEGPVIGHLATVDADGAPHVTPVWIDVADDGHLLVNTARGRRKERNVLRDARVALSAVDPDDAYRMVAVLGRVIDVVEDGADEHLDRLAAKYLGHERFPFDTEHERRVILRILVQAVKEQKGRPTRFGEALTRLWP